MKISSLLTGYDETGLVATGMSDVYYGAVLTNARDVVGNFFEEVDALLLESDNDEKKLEAAIALRLIPLSCYNGLAQNIITMWYVGMWGNTVISPEAYVQGLVWPNANTHPFGAKQPGYGSWAEPPAEVTTP